MFETVWLLVTKAEQLLDTLRPLASTIRAEYAAERIMLVEVSAWWNGLWVIVAITGAVLLVGGLYGLSRHKGEYWSDSLASIPTVGGFIILVVALLACAITKNQMQVRPIQAETPTLQIVRGALRQRGL